MILFMVFKDYFVKSLKLNSFSCLIVFENKYNFTTTAAAAAAAAAATTTTTTSRLLIQIQSLSVKS